MNLHIGNRKITLILILVGLLSFAFLVPEVLAANLKEKVRIITDTTADSGGFGAAKDPRVVIAQMVQILLSLLGSLFIVLICMSGFWYITARGRSERVEKATDTMRRAVVGLIIVVMAYTVTYFVAQQVQYIARGKGKLTCNPNPSGWVDRWFGELPPC